MGVIYVAAPGTTQHTEQAAVVSAQTSWQQHGLRINEKLYIGAQGGGP
jgi:hypothetical protein